MSSVTVEQCDRCCQPARVEWWKPEGRRKLTACWHHAREWGPTLLAAGFLARTLIDPATDHQPGGPLPAVH